MQNRQIISLLLSFIKPYRTTAVITVIVTFVTVLLLNFISPLFTAQILTHFQSGDVSLTSTWPIIIGYGLAQIFGGIIGWRVVLWLIWRFETRIQTDIHNRVFKKIINQSIDFHTNRFGGSLVSQVNRFVGAFEMLWDEIIWNIIPAVTSVTAAMIMLGFYFWQYALILIIVSISFITVVFISSKFMVERTKAETEASTTLTGYITDSIGNIAVVKSNSREVYETERIDNQATVWRNKSLSVMRGILLSSSIFSSLTTILSIIALIAAILASEWGWLSISLAYLVVTYTGQVIHQLWNVTNIVRKYYRIIGDASEIAKILSTKTDLVDHSRQKLSIKHGAIDFKNISYTYQSGAKANIFNDFNLTIPAGQRVGIVGRSGSGKTSLTRILLRFSDVDHGKITIDQQDITKITQNSLHQVIAYVPQESSLFHRTIRENIAYGKPTASETEIITAAKQANAWDFIQALPEGLDTIVGERGSKLSGGQRQRIAIARAILKDAPILVLDEATSALDSESEQLIQNSLDVLMKDRTSLVIAHRLSTIAKLDRIVVIDQGEIIEDGSHDELIKLNGIYADLWQRQSGGFIE
ncbi:MAG: ABC transporter ATP-binding protein [Candidatus Saccharibacteria bacterium]|nr:ABC transporter ATP-binding protein [Candidatus Saccharibacteria bacterium]